MIAMRAAYVPSFEKRSKLQRTSVGDAGSALSCGLISCGTDAQKWANDIHRVIREYIVGTYGDDSSASYKKAFDLKANVGSCTARPDGVCIGPYWTRKELADFLYQLSACAPTSATSGPDCEATAQSIVEKFDKDGDSAIVWEEFRDGLGIAADKLLLGEAIQAAIDKAGKPGATPISSKYAGYQRSTSQAQSSSAVTSQTATAKNNTALWVAGGLAAAVILGIVLL